MTTYRIDWNETFSYLNHVSVLDDGPHRFLRLDAILVFLHFRSMLKQRKKSAKQHHVHCTSSYSHLSRAYSLITSYSLNANEIIIQLRTTSWTVLGLLAIKPITPAVH